MGVIKYFENAVEKKAHKMLKHKRFYAWIFFVVALCRVIKIVQTLYDLWDSYWRRAWQLYIRSLKEKRNDRKREGEKCPYKTEGDVSGD